MSNYKNKEFQHRTFLESFKNSMTGLFYIVKHERNSRRMFLAAFMAIAAGFYFNISRIEWLALILTIAIVIVSEIYNTLVEYLADLFRKKYDRRIKILKDLASAAPLFASFISLIIAAIIFIPKIIK